MLFQVWWRTVIIVIKSEFCVVYYIVTETRDT